MNRPMLQVCKIATKLQGLIGDGAKVTLLVKDDALEIQVDWWSTGFHAKRHFTENELAQLTDEGLFLDYFVMWCKNEYARKVISKL